MGRLISGAEPLTEVHVSRSTSNHRRYLEKVRSWPDRFVVLGDALATFNPAYGQGMSVAALGARVLDRELRTSGLGEPGLARRVQRRAARPVEAAWTMAVSQDVFYPGTRGGSPGVADRLVTAYTRRMIRTATGSYTAAIGALGRDEHDDGAGAAATALNGTGDAERAPFAGGRGGAADGGRADGPAAAGPDGTLSQGRPDPVRAPSANSRAGISGPRPPSPRLAPSAARFCLSSARERGLGQPLPRARHHEHRPRQRRRRGRAPRGPS